MAEPTLDISELRKPEFKIGTTSFRAQKMPTTKAFAFLNSVRAEMGHTNRPANAMSVALSAANAVSGGVPQSIDDVDPAQAAEMLQTFLELLFGLSEHFVENEVRLGLFRYLEYRRDDQNSWYPVYDGALDSTDEMTDDWAVVMELIVRLLAVNFIGTSRLSEWKQKIESLITSRSKRSG